MITMLHRFSSARILVVDDDIVSQQIIAGALSNAGFHKIRTAHDGDDALEKTYRLNPDLVILDLNMPHLDGFGYCEHVRNTTELPRMPILVQTVVEEREAKLRALACGADDFLHKPLDMNELALRVCGQLERYFMLQELQDMCLYLKMELSQIKGVMKHAEKSKLPRSVLATLNRHCEVIETLAVLPTASMA